MSVHCSPQNCMWAQRCKVTSEQKCYLQYKRKNNKTNKLSASCNKYIHLCSMYSPLYHTILFKRAIHNMEVQATDALCMLLYIITMSTFPILFVPLFTNYQIPILFYLKKHRLYIASSGLCP